MRWLLVAMMLTVTPAAAAEPTLATTDKEAYRQSLLAIAQTRSQDEVMKFLFHLGNLALGPSPLKGMAHLEAVQKLAKDEEAFLKGIAPYSGMTYDQIMAAKP